jgi:hypothetical protein
MFARPTEGTLVASASSENVITRPVPARRQR